MLRLTKLHVPDMKHSGHCIKYAKVNSKKSFTVKGGHNNLSHWFLLLFIGLQYYTLFLLSSTCLFFRTTSIGNQMSKVHKSFDNYFTRKTHKRTRRWESLEMYHADQSGQGSLAYIDRWTYRVNRYEIFKSIYCLMWDVIITIFPQTHSVMHPWNQKKIK